MSNWGLTEWAQMSQIMGTVSSGYHASAQARYSRRAREDQIAHNLKIQKKMDAAAKQRDQTVPEQATEKFMKDDLVAMMEGGRGYGQTMIERLKILPEGGLA